MPSQTIFLIRHAEKPDAGGDSGVDGTGKPDDRSLTPRGWQRAGMWTEIFAPSLSHASELPTPATIFASAPAEHSGTAAGKDGSKSRRPLETVTALASKLGIQVDLSYEKGQEGNLATALSDTEGVTLVCWQHEDIGDIARALAKGVSTIPADWPGNRFNIAYRFDRTDSNANWTFKQVVAVMFKEDSSAPID